MNINKSVIVGTTLLVIWFISPLVSPVFRIAGSLLGFSTGNLYAADGGDNYGDNYIVCGNGRVDSGEQCDDGNTQDGDGCSGICMIEPTGPRCGDTNLDPGEECDDGNTTGGDGCSDQCQSEPNDLVAYYEFEYNANDLSGNGNNGILYGNEDFGILASGNYFAKFDGIHDYIEVPHSQSLSLGAMTVSYWVKPQYTNYLGKTYEVINKGENPTGYKVEFIGENRGFSPISGGTGDTDGLGAPTNLVAQYGGTNTDGKHIVYLTWEDNSKDEDGFTVEISEQLVSCDECETEVPANTTSLRVLLDNLPQYVSHNVNIYAHANDHAVESNKAYAKVRVDGTLSNPQPSSPISEWIPLDGKWHQVTQTRSMNGNYKYYVDGKLVRSLNGNPVSLPGATNPLLIGTIMPPAEVGHSVYLNDDGALISWSSIAGKRYLVQYKGEMTDWNDLPTIVEAQGPTSSLLDPSGRYEVRDYRVFLLDDKAFVGELDKLAIYDKVLSDSEIGLLYSKAKPQFRDIDRGFVSLGSFTDLSELKFSQAMDELEQLSQKYSFVWGDPVRGIDTQEDATAYSKQRWTKQKQFYIEYINLMDKYGVTGDDTVAGILAVWEPLWQEQYNQMFNQPAPQMSSAQTSSNSTQAMGGDAATGSSGGSDESGSGGSGNEPPPAQGAEDEGYCRACGPKFCECKCPKGSVTLLDSPFFPILPSILDLAGISGSDAKFKIQTGWTASATETLASRDGGECGPFKYSNLSLYQRSADQFFESKGQYLIDTGMNIQYAEKRGVFWFGGREGKEDHIDHPIVGEFEKYVDTRLGQDYNKLPYIAQLSGAEESTVTLLNGTSLKSLMPAGGDILWDVRKYGNLEDSPAFSSVSCGPGSVSLGLSAKADWLTQPPKNLTQETLDTIGLGALGPLVSKLDKMRCLVDTEHHKLSVTSGMSTKNLIGVEYKWVDPGVFKYIKTEVNVGTHDVNIQIVIPLDKK